MLATESYNFCANEVEGRESAAMSATNACAKRSVQPPEDEEGSVVPRSCEGMLTGHAHGCRDDPFCGHAVADDPNQKGNQASSVVAFARCMRWQCAVM